MNDIDKYTKALSRNDLSQWLVHFCKPTLLTTGITLNPFEALKNILKSHKLFSSKRESITRYAPEGATCFYDIPPMLYQQVVETNPNGRRGYGIIIGKTSFWAMGGRPVIYTDNTNAFIWPENERFKLVYTNLSRNNPNDWTHEREWRMKGDLDFQMLYKDGLWWPCVERIKDSQLLFREFSYLYNIYVLEFARVINREEILI